MAVTSVVALLALAVSAHGSVGPSTNDSLCSESRECLQYQLLCKTEEYEVRRYSPTRWVSTDAEAYFMGVGAAMAFRRLFQYITGDNQGGYQMDMTAPVLVKIPEETRTWEPAIYTLSFPLPSAYQDRPPQPNNDKLYFTNMPQMDVYVRSYGGWMLSVTARLHAHLLTKELDRVRAVYNGTWHYGVGYDSPLKLLNRHNEVWYVSEGEPVCSDPHEPTPPHPVKRQFDQTPDNHQLSSNATTDPSVNPDSLQGDQPLDDPEDDHPTGIQKDDHADMASSDTSLDTDQSSNPTKLQSEDTTLDPSSQLPEVFPPSTANTSISNSSNPSPTGESPPQATPSSTSSQELPSSSQELPSSSQELPSSLQPTNGAPSQAPTSAHNPLELTPTPNSTQSEEPTHNEP